MDSGAEDSEFEDSRNRFPGKQGDCSYQTEDEGSCTGRRGAGAVKRRRQPVQSIQNRCPPTCPAFCEPAIKTLDEPPYVSASVSVAMTFSLLDRCASQADTNVESEAEHDDGERDDRQRHERVPPRRLLPPSPTTYSLASPTSL